MKTLLAMVVGTTSLLTTTGIALAQNGSKMNGGAGSGGWTNGYSAIVGYGGIWVPSLLVILVVGFVAWIMMQKAQVNEGNQPIRGQIAFDNEATQLVALDTSVAKIAAVSPVIEQEVTMAFRSPAPMVEVDIGREVLTRRKGLHWVMGVLI